MDVPLRTLLLTLGVLQSFYVYTQAQSGSGAPGGQQPMCQVEGCQNGGTCLDDGTCSCPGIYVGRLCDKIDCLNSGNAASICGNNGVCNDDPSTPNCFCNDGYFGAKCDQVQDNCGSDPCANGGTCINDPPFRYNCMCDGPWAGRNCDVYDPCRVLQCGVYGDCRAVKEGDGPPVARCRCQRGWEGQLCNIDKNECLTGEGGCLNGGTCINQNSTFSCNCPPGVSGTYCEIDVNGEYTNSCEGYVCNNGGQCSNDRPWQPRCLCEPGWTGNRCERAGCVREYNGPGGDGGYEYEEYERPLIEDIQNMDFAYNIAEDYCLFDGKCVIDSPSSLPRCECQLGYAGDRCFYRTTILQSISPLVGVEAGGTLIYFRGVNMNGTFIPSVMFGGTPCPVVYGNNTLIVCRTLPAIIPAIVGTPQNITISWQRFSGYLDPDQEFTYKPNPNITSVEPRATILGGGVTLTVTGVGLDAVGQPLLEVSVVYRGAVVHVFSSPCTVINSTIMHCPTPKLEIVDADGNLDFTMLPGPTPPPYAQGPGQFGPGGFSTTEARRRRSASIHEQLSESAGSRILSMLGSYLHRSRRQVSDDTKLTEFKVNNETIEFHLGFKLDGVATYRNLTEALPQYSRLTVYVDPEIERWTMEQEVRTGNRILEVQGDRLLVGIKETDYTMYIGESKCSPLEVFSNKLVCTAPDDTPAPHPDDTNQAAFNVRVHVGVLKEPFVVGQVTYKTSFWDNPQAKWGVVGACIAAGLILCIIIAVCIARKTARAY